MGQQVELVLVGARKGKDELIKNVQFRGGRAIVFAPDEHMAGILRYMETQGAFPALVADQKQKEIDLYLASKGDRDALAERKAKLQAELAALEAVEPPVVPASPEPETKSEPEAPEPPAEVEAADGEVQDQEAAEAGEDESSEGGQSSSRRGRRR